MIRGRSLRFVYAGKSLLKAVRSDFLGSVKGSFVLHQQIESIT